MSGTQQMALLQRPAMGAIERDHGIAMNENVPILGIFESRLPPRLTLRRCFTLYYEALLLTGISIVILTVFGWDQEGTLSLFLVAAALTDRFNAFIDENRDNIYELKLTWSKTNSLTGFSILAMFLGIMTAYAVSVAVLGEQETVKSFAFALEKAHLRHGNIFTRRFSTFSGLLSHNSLVWLTVFFLAFLYRAYGVLLALVWNACLWGIILTLLILRGVHASSLSQILFVPAAILSLLPHLTLEAAAYVTAGLCGIFLSKGFIKYGYRDTRLWEVGFAVVKLSVVSLALLAMGCLMESCVAPFALSFLR